MVFSIVVLNTIVTPIKNNCAIQKLSHRLHGECSSWQQLTVLQIMTT